MQFLQVSISSSLDQYSTLSIYYLIQHDVESRFADSVVTKQLIPYQGFQLLTPPIIQIIASRGSERFCEEPYATIINVVCEFFANKKVAVDNRCYVRGKWVTFDFVSINNYSAFFNTPINPDDILNVLCGPESTTSWKKDNRIINFPASFITQTSNKVTRDRALLNYSIQMGYNIDVGKPIFLSTMYMIRGTTSVGLGHVDLYFHSSALEGL
ncbi:hypothetical protein IEQ34_020549 [Dendrobium chrysotoxum]|uniref:Putative plant transposon protein domain-containing protein n=1 Tax=Dendrobium chrysotoxum TaxID=161865 RepID=A0AAV7G2D2_DENCH|nr:hypothetical protein IEQ34_020549 [Dendrobium chrysotoxum]